MSKEKAKQIIKVLKKWIEKGENGKLKRYTLSSKLQTEEKIKELEIYLITFKN
jgi:hypothetical protein|tara:strand:+ start:29672 stop:29830 length:159 start_codon:yes stop_codon:yes gene_type:complete